MWVWGEGIKTLKLRKKEEEVFSRPGLLHKCCSLWKTVKRCWGTILERKEEPGVEVATPTQEKKHK
jgi:hypothetical protein